MHKYKVAIQVTLESLIIFYNFVRNNLDLTHPESLELFLFIISLENVIQISDAGNLGFISPQKGLLRMILPFTASSSLP